MKSILKVCNMDTTRDINKIREAVSNNEGVMACQMNKETGEVGVVYDSNFLTLNDVIESIEDLGYTVL